MSPALLRAIFGGFFALMAGVAINTLWLQPDRPQVAKVTTGASQQHARLTAAATDPRPLLQSATDTDAMRVARLAPDSAAPAKMPVIPEAEGDPVVIRTVQKELLKRGYGPVVPNGIIGPLSRAAIMAYEFDNALPLTGEATEVLLKRMRDGVPAVRSPDPQARKIRSLEAEQVVRTVQHSLTSLGYDAGRIDGRVGDETERAIRQFEAASGLAATGRISAELFSQLARAIGAKSAALR
jgi:peptidoglycan hydrolase-like protein with peptidoglycan-binding domain